jgi:hypothetical protein
MSEPHRDIRTVKWMWMMDWCEKYRLSPADWINWKHAEVKWQEYRRDLEAQEASIEMKGSGDAG